MKYAILILPFLLACAHSPMGRTPSSDQAAERDSKSIFLDDQAECKSFSEEVSAQQNEVISSVMGSHEHRLYHALWHATRNGWSDFNAKQQAILKKLSPAWGLNAKLCTVNKTTRKPMAFASSKMPPSGEEFLLMHHQMIDLLRSSLARENLSCIAGWKQLPEKNDKLWPVPQGEKDDSSKSDENLSMMQAWQKQLHDLKFLKGKSLSYVGYLIEFSLHNNMHMRWATLPKKGDDFSPLDSSSFTFHSIQAESEYDKPEYNWLGNPYGAHVNAVFWKLHGWVDDTIPLWLEANGYDSIATDCQKKPKCYQWRSNWVGASPHAAAAASSPKGMHHHGGEDAAPMSESDEKAVNAILAKGSFKNQKFHCFKNPEDPACGSSSAPKSMPRPHDGGASQPNLNDVEVYLQQFGPCSP